MVQKLRAVLTASTVIFVSILLLFRLDLDETEKHLQDEAGQEMLCEQSLTDSLNIHTLLDRYMRSNKEKQLPTQKTQGMKNIVKISAAILMITAFSLLAYRRRMLLSCNRADVFSLRRFLSELSACHEKDGKKRSCAF